MRRSRTQVLLTAVSWEDRFIRGLERLLARETLDSVILLDYRRESERTVEHRCQAVRICEAEGCRVKAVSVAYSNPVEAWWAIHAALEEIRGTCVKVLLDISTMPRESIWAAVFLLHERGVRIRYAYHMPASYGSWLSRDSGVPRLALKLSGEMRFGAKTVLCVVTGFDRERTLQLIRTFDPATVLLGIQRGSQFENVQRNKERHKESQWLRGEGHSIEYFSVDAYSDDHGFADIVGQIERHVVEDNVLMASLGPKLSAISLFRVQRRFSMTGLVYTPSGEYNLEYSRGIGDTIIGELPRTVG